MYVDHFRRRQGVKIGLDRRRGSPIPGPLKDYSPTTMYDDYPIFTDALSLHWQSSRSFIEAPPSTGRR